MRFHLAFPLTISRALVCAWSCLMKLEVNWCGVSCTAVHDGIQADGHQRDSVHSAGGEGH